jgi:hypothetical protein
MSKHTLWVSIESITLLRNGDVPGQTTPAGEEKRNAIVASLTYPRSGAPTVTSGQQYNLPENEPFRPDQADFFASGLFKEEVEDETILQIKVTDTDKIGKAEKIFLTVMGVLVNAGLTAATGGLTGFFGAIAGAGVSQVQTGMAGVTGDQVYIVGETDKIKLKMNDLPTDRNNPQRMTLGLIIPSEIDKPFFVIDPETHQPVTKRLTLAKGSPNGTITLNVAAVPTTGLAQTAATGLT